MGFFAIAEGSKCFCGPFIEGTSVDDAKCATACSGDQEAGCGGPLGSSGTYANLYIMYDCAENTEEEQQQIEEEKWQHSLDSYAVLAGQSCGQAIDNTVEVGNEDAKETFVGSVDECKMMCLHSLGSVECHGFTYDKVFQKCTFHPDVMHGEITKTDKQDCYFKKLGLLQASVLTSTASRTSNATAHAAARRCRAMPKALLQQA